MREEKREGEISVGERDDGETEGKREREREREREGGGGGAKRDEKDALYIRLLNSS